MPWYGFRLHSAGGKAWCAGSAQKSEWLLVDLGVASTISGIVTQGRGAVKEWITNFMVSYSSDAYNWDYARDIYGNKKVSAFGYKFIYGLSSSLLSCLLQAKLKPFVFTSLHP